jgi:membrane glycosyltransferase
MPPYVGGFRTFVRRTLFFGTVVVVDACAVLWLADLFYRIGPHRAHIVLLALFALLNGLLVLGSMHAVAGAWEFIKGKWRVVRITDLAGDGQGPLRERFAVVMPVYNEDIVKVMGRVEAIFRSIDATGHLASFDFYILSDTTNLDLWVAEEVAWANACRKLNAFGRIYYRRRRKNENRKAGNIGDFVRTWGGHYEAMLVLDADSLMDGADIVKMTRTMEAYPRLGILQTPPKLIRGSSVFTRMQQFAMRLYGPLFIRGLNFWQLGSGSYWGHNALIRLQPFSEFCELPALPGREPFGGRILSHDFVEAALMVREGWEVWLAWDIQGTYEEAPPTLIDHLKRDRRWCQGNLQHMWLIFARKFPLPARIHLFMGIMAYLGSPVWFLFLLAGSWLAWDRVNSGLSYLPFDGYVARWFGLTNNQQALALSGLVFFLLFIPKVMAFAGGILHGKTRRGFGGVIPMACGLFLETVLSMLLAPCVMFEHTFMVVGMMLGRSVSWGNQTRETDGTAWVDALRFHGPCTLLGLAWTVVAWRVGPTFLAWMSPILCGMLLAIPLSVWTSRSRYGKALLNRKILSTPEENSLPEIMRLADHADAAVDPSLTADAPHRTGIIAAIVDPYVNGVHVSLLDPTDTDKRADALAVRFLKEGRDALPKDELTDVLYHSSSMLAMHRGVWSLPFESLHPMWITAIESYRIRTEADRHTAN